jgi:hypothetical protein
MTMPSLLHALNPSSVQPEPFPYICVEGLLDDAFCRELASSVPPIETFMNGRVYPDNHKLHRRAYSLVGDDSLTQHWQRLVADHLMPDTFTDMVRLFAPYVAQEYPALARKLERPDSIRVGVRNLEKDYDVYLDAKLVLHTPVTGMACAERAPHVKAANKLFEFVLCLRQDEDIAPGGDLILHRSRDGVAPRFGARNQTDPRSVVPVRTIRRRRNTLVGWMNTARSVTEVTPRATSPYSSVYFQVLAEFPYDLFRLPGLNWSDRLARLVSRRIPFAMPQSG